MLPWTRTTCWLVLEVGYFFNNLIGIVIFIYFAFWLKYTSIWKQKHEKSMKVHHESKNDYKKNNNVHVTADGSGEPKKKAILMVGSISGHEHRLLEEHHDTFSKMDSKHNLTLDDIWH